MVRAKFSTDLAELMRYFLCLIAQGIGWDEVWGEARTDGKCRTSDCRAGAGRIILHQEPWLRWRGYHPGPCVGCLFIASKSTA